MSKSGGPRGPLSRDPKLDGIRVEPTGLCWWCGARASTEEHRFKHSTLRRVARGTDPTNVFKKSDDFAGTLRSLSKGSQVRWRKNLCAPCNNARSQPFDRAYDTFENFAFQHRDGMGGWGELRWRQVYGDDWQVGARNLARYFGKQIGCMLASQDLPVPRELVEFLDGTERCPSVNFMLFRNWKAISAHRVMRRHDSDSDGIMSFIGLLPSQAYTRNGQFSGVTYGYHIGYVWACADWHEGTDRTSWFEYETVPLGLVNDSMRDRLSWTPHLMAMEARLRHRDVNNAP